MDTLLHVLKIVGIIACALVFIAISEHNDRSRRRGGRPASRPRTAPDRHHGAGLRGRGPTSRVENSAVGVKPAVNRQPAAVKTPPSLAREISPPVLAGPRLCARPGCGEHLPYAARSDARYCRQSCRQLDYLRRKTARQGDIP